MDEPSEARDDAEGVAPDTTPDDTGFLLAESPSHLLHRAQQYAAELFAGLYDKHVTLRQFAVLAAVQAHAGGTQTDLVRATGIDRSTLAEMIARMEKKGLVVRAKSNADGRAKSVRLTGRGRARLAEATPHAHAADLAILDALPKPKRRALLDILQALTPVIDAAHTAEDSDKPDRKASKKRKKEDKATKPAAEAKTKTAAKPKAGATPRAPKSKPEAEDARPAKDKSRPRAKTKR